MDMNHIIGYIGTALIMTALSYYMLWKCRQK